MWRAALPCCRSRHLVVLALAVFVAVAPAGATSTAPSSSAAPRGEAIWAIALPASLRTAKPAQLRWLADQGVTSLLVTDASRTTLSKLSTQARHAGLNVIVPSRQAPRTACKPALGHLQTCAAVAGTATAAVKLARRSLVDIVVVRVQTPTQLRMLRGTKTSRSRIVAVLPASMTPAAQAAWRAGIAYAATDPSLDLAVAAAPTATKQLRSYLAALPQGKTVSSAPGAPLSLAVTGTSASTISLAWAAAGGAESYGIYLDGTFVLALELNSLTLTGLGCGRTYTLAVDAVAGSSRSTQTSVSASTAACPTGAGISGGGGSGGGGSGGGTADTLPPSAPLTLASSASTTTSITVGWPVSTDNVAVTGYGRYRNGVLLSSGSSTSYTFTGLTCNTSYTLGVDAFDAAANRSARTSGSFTTAACGGGGGGADTQAPSVPQGQSLTPGQTSVTMGWTAATDNVGVAGYRAFKDGVAQGTTTALSYTFPGLTCATTYTFALEAYDAAGNASNRALATGTTATLACDSPPPPPPPPASGTAHLWVDTNGGSCARQATPGAYADAQACTWNGAYQAAQTGDLIVVRGGSYGDVTIGPNKPSVAAPGVTFQPASGETVTVSDLENGYYSGGASNITFLGPVTARTFRSDGGSNIVVDGWRVDCGGCDNVQMFHLESATNVTVRNSDISDNQNNSLIWIQGTNLTFENNVIHDAGLPSGSSAHTECMYAWNVTNLTLKRNHFYHCAVMDVFITGSSVAHGGVVENNIFEKPWSSTGQISNTALAFHFRNGGSPPTPDPDNWDFRYNTFVGPLSITTDANPVGAGGMRIIGNAFLAGAPCGHANTTYSYNAFVSGGCGSNNITHSLSTYLAGFTSSADPGNYSLRSTSVLRDSGNTANYPAQDRTGTARYTGAAPDIGAYEAGS